MQLITPYQLHNHQSSVPILYEDNHLLVVWKERGELVQADRSGTASLQDKLKSHLKNKYGKPGNVFLGIVHRLDRPVSGVMIFARTSKAASRVSEQIRQRSVDKSYLAVCKGEMKLPQTFEDYLVKNHKTNRVYIDRDGAGNSDAKLARLHATPLAFKQGYTLMHIRLETGRPHQIRVQLSNAGYPVAGDQKYGNVDHHLPIHLQSIRFSLTHPTLNERMNFIGADLYEHFNTHFSDAIQDWILQFNRDHDQADNH